MPGATLVLGGVERSPVMDNGRLVGFTEADFPSTLKCRISVGFGDSLALYQAIRGATVTFECDAGPVYVIREAAVRNVLTLETSGPGNVDLELVGSPAIEMLG